MLRGVCLIPCRRIPCRAGVGVRSDAASAQSAEGAWEQQAWIDALRPLLYDKNVVEAPNRS